MKNNWKSLLAGVLALVMLLSCTAALRRRITLSHWWMKN